jgi:hypothetical protein
MMKKKEKGRKITEIRNKITGFRSRIAVRDKLSTEWTREEKEGINGFNFGRSWKIIE